MKLPTVNRRQPTAQRTDTPDKSTYGTHIYICPLFILIVEWANAKERACRHIREINFQKCPTAQQKQTTLQQTADTYTDDKTAQGITAPCRHAGFSAS